MLAGDATARRARVRARSRSVLEPRDFMGISRQVPRYRCLRLRFAAREGDDAMKGAFLVLLDSAL